MSSPLTASPSRCPCGSTDEGKLYLCAIKYAFSGRIVGYSMSDRMKARLAVNALDNAATRRGDVAGCIVHSDRGSQFRSRKGAYPRVHEPGVGPVFADIVDGRARMRAGRRHVHFPLQLFFGMMGVARSEATTLNDPSASTLR